MYTSLLGVLIYFKMQFSLKTAFFFIRMELMIGIYFHDRLSEMVGRLLWIFICPNRQTA